MWTMETVITIASLVTNLVQTIALAYIRQRWNRGRSVPPPAGCERDDELTTVKDDTSTRKGAER